MVNGSFSVVNQLHALVLRKCLDIDARVLCVVEVDSRVRVVVMVDVYLPVLVWSSGWQFPKSGSVAGAVFRHLRFVYVLLVLFRFWNSMMFVCVTEIVCTTNTNTDTSTVILF